MSNCEDLDLVLVSSEKHLGPLAAALDRIGATFERFVVDNGVDSEAFGTALCRSKRLLAVVDQFPETVGQLLQQAGSFPSCHISIVCVRGGVNIDDFPHAR